jgi:hypothetical protein
MLCSPETKGNDMGEIMLFIALLLIGSFVILALSGIGVELQGIRKALEARNQKDGIGKQ